MTNRPTTAFDRMRDLLRGLRLGYLLPCLVLAAGVWLTHDAWNKARMDIESALQTDFNIRVQEISSAVSGRMQSYEQILQATYGMFAAFKSVEHDEFKVFVNSMRIKETHPGIVEVGFSLIVPPQEREHHIASMRKSGFPNYTIKPAGARRLYSSAIYIEPFGGEGLDGLDGLGVDNYAEPSRRYAMDVARDTGKIAISNKIRLPEEDATRVQAGLRMYLAVYRNGAPHATVAERRANIIGWVYAAYNADRLLDNILNQRDKIVIEIFDGDDMSDSEHAFDSVRDRVGGESSMRLFFAAKQLDFGGYTWTLTARSLPNLMSNLEISKIKLVAMMGIVSSILIALLTWLLLHRRYTAQAEAAAMKQRAATLTEANVKLSVANEVAEKSRQQATRALEDLRAAQAQLIQSEKLASLGQLVANVAHEINTPISAMKSSGKNIADALDHALDSIPELFRLLDTETRRLFMKLVRTPRSVTVISTREERALIREVTRQLDQAGIGDSRDAAGLFVQLQAQDSVADYLPLLRHPESQFILDTARTMGTIINSTGNINTAVDRVSRIIFALKSISRIDNSGVLSEANLQDGMETVLTVYGNQFKQGAELIRQYEDIPPLLCLPDELNQMWANLIHNALQAMNHVGKLTVGMRRVGDEAVVSITDTGCGIPEENRARIFDAFFTTQPIGEGSGLGLDIVKKIVDKHKGRIEVQSQVGVGSTFSVYLPLGVPATGAQRTASQQKQPDSLS